MKSGVHTMRLQTASKGSIEKISVEPFFISDIKQSKSQPQIILKNNDCCMPGNKVSYEYDIDYASTTNILGRTFK